MVHNSQVGNSRALPANGVWSMLLAAPTFLSLMVSQRMQSNKPRTCLRNKKDDSDPLLGLPNLRNVPRDQVLGSPAQRLMSRCTRCVLHIAKQLLVPKALNTRYVSSRLKLKRQQQTSNHDQHAKPLLPLYHATSD